MTKPTNFAFVLVLLPIACGPSAQSDTGGDTDSSTGSSEGGSSVSASTTMTTLTTTTASTSMSSTDPTTTDPTVTDPTTESTSPDSSTGGGGDGCCDVHAGAGCNEDAVEMCVCEASPDCCVFGWEKNCVDVAMNMCAATCMGAEESSSGGGSSSESTGGGGEACGDVVEIDLEATDATLSGEWTIIMSMAGEGMVAAFDPADNDPMTDDIVHWDIDVPCDDDWYIWVRGFDNGQDDSFFATLDGEPNPAPIFEVECTGASNGYLWTRLNQRDPVMGNPCEYVEDPWIATWPTGTHAFDLAFRESQAVARIIITNDEAFVPM